MLRALRVPCRYRKDIFCFIVPFYTISTLFLSIRVSLFIGFYCPQRTFIASTGCLRHASFWSPVVVPRETSDFVRSSSIFVWTVSFFPFGLPANILCIRYPRIAFWTCTYNGLSEELISFSVCSFPIHPSWFYITAPYYYIRRRTVISKIYVFFSSYTLCSYRPDFHVHRTALGTASWNIDIIFDPSIKVSIWTIIPGAYYYIPRFRTQFSV